MISPTKCKALSNLKLKRLYISGCGGMLGDAVYPHFKENYSVKATDINVNEDWLTYLDVRDFEAYKKDVTDFKPDVLIHLAALTDLEYCEKHIEETYDTNTKAVENAVIIASQLDITLVYICTAGIFDGEKDVYDDWDQPTPLNHYGRSKYYGERYVAENGSKYFVFRAGWMTGGGPKKDKKFVNKILKQIREGKKELFIVNDKLGTPTYTYDFAKNMEVVLQTPYYGVYNMVCDEITSRLEVTQEIVKVLNREDEIKITEVTSDYWKEEYFATRPYSERLMNAKLNLRNLNLMGGWRERIHEYLHSYYSDLIKK
jgi:dTDP-4-dehydrorhamnose reductase